MTDIKYKHDKRDEQNIKRSRLIFSRFQMLKTVMRSCSANFTCYLSYDQKVDSNICYVHLILCGVLTVEGSLLHWVFCRKKSTLALTTLVLIFSWWFIYKELVTCFEITMQNIAIYFVKIFRKRNFKNYSIKSSHW